MKDQHIVADNCEVKLMIDVTIKRSKKTFSSAGTERIVSIDGKLEGDKHKAILEENLLKCEKDLRLGRRFTFQ